MSHIGSILSRVSVHQLLPSATETWVQQQTPPHTNTHIHLQCRMLFNIHSPSHRFVNTFSKSTVQWCLAERAPRRAMNLLYGDAFAIAKAIALRWPQWAKIAERKSVSCSLTDLRFATRRSAVRRVKNGRRNSQKGPGRSVFAPLVSKGSA